jgi:hypothetical protein
MSGLVEFSGLAPDDPGDTIRVFPARDKWGHRRVCETGLEEGRLTRMSLLAPHPSIAPWFVEPHNGELMLVHESPPEARPSNDLFDVAQVVGGLLDGLAWLHGQGFAHGAISWVTLVEGQKGGRLSLAGACGSATIDATAEDDVYAVAALVYRLLTGRSHMLGSPPLARLAWDVPLTISTAIDRALDPDPAQRPAAADLAVIIRGDWLPPLLTVGEPRGSRRSWWRGGLVNEGVVIVAVALILCIAIVVGMRIDRNGRETVQVVTPPVSTEVAAVPTTTTTTTTVATTVTTTVAPPSSGPPTTSAAPVTMSVVSVPLPSSTAATTRG